jgi:hypothetical protein
MFAKHNLYHSSSYYKTITVSVGFMKNNLRSNAFSEFINCVYVLGADNQRNKMTTFFYLRMPFLSIKPFLLSLHKLRRGCLRIDSVSKWVMDKSKLVFLWEHPPGRRRKSSRIRHMWLHHWLAMWPWVPCQPQYPPLVEIRNLLERICVRNKRGSFM